MGSVASLNSLMAVMAPVIGASLLGVVHRRAGDWHRPAVLLRALPGCAAPCRLAPFRRQPPATARRPPIVPETAMTTTRS